jgi:hypothetical protein
MEATLTEPRAVVVLLAWPELVRAKAMPAMAMLM